MGFFGDLKQDLSQAVNELIPEENVEKAVSVQEDASEAESPAEETNDIDLEKMLDEAIGGDIVSAEEPAADDTGADSSEAESAVEDAFSDMEKSADFSLEGSGFDELNDTSFKGAERKMDSNTNYSEETSVITLGMTVNGDITTEGSLEILGNVKGNIDVAGKLNITGHVNGNSKAREVFAENAKITGDVASESSIKIGAGTVIVGNITGFSAAVAGAVKGDIDVHGPVILDSSAIVMGNIRSKSVQINNGAAIEGSVSQCYADVSPTSFFDEYKPETVGGKKNGGKSDKN